LKLVRLQFEGEEVPAGLGEFGDYTASGPMAELRVDRTKVTRTLGAILDRWTVVDMSVHDPPLEQVIARVLEEGRSRQEAAAAEAAPQVRGRCILPWMRRRLWSGGFA
jgi:hypothetical protein